MTAMARSVNSDNGASGDGANPDRDNRNSPHGETSSRHGTAETASSGSTHNAASAPRAHATVGASSARPTERRSGRPTTRIASSSDPDLSADIRTGSMGAAQEALDELYRRHSPTVSHYAHKCFRNPRAANDLLSEAFARTFDTVRAGEGPTEAWRPHLLTALRRTAAAWPDTALRDELAPPVQHWLPEASTTEDAEDRMLRLEDGNLTLRAYRSLPERWQCVLWHQTVEAEPPTTTAQILGIAPDSIDQLTARAHAGLREAYLALHTERVDGAGLPDECRRYTSLLSATVRGTGRREDPELERHLTECPHCQAALRDLTQLKHRLDRTLPRAILLSASTDSHTAPEPPAPAPAPTPAVSPAAAVTRRTANRATRALSHSPKLAATVGAGILLAGAGLGTTLFHNSGGDDPTNTTAAPSSSTPTADPEQEPAPRETSRKADRHHRDKQRPADGTASPRSTDTAPRWKPQADERTKLRIAATNRCMDIAISEGAQPRATTCRDRPSQQWELLVDQSVQETRIRNLASGKCLTHTGTEADGAPVRQRSCDTSSRYIRWTYAPQGGDIAFTKKGSTIHSLGLNDWNAADEGKPHSTTVGTTANYYNSPSLRFSYAGDALTK